jgi:hypothetical protein
MRHPFGPWALLLALLAPPGCARDGVVPAGGGAALPREFQGLALLDPEVRPPGPESAVGHIAVTIENRSTEPIPFARIGLPDLVGRAGTEETKDGFHFLRNLADYEEPTGALEPGATRTVVLSAVRVRGDSPIEVRARAWLKVNEERWQDVVSDPVTVTGDAWPVAPPLRASDLDLLSAGAGGAHVRLEREGTFAGPDVLEALPDGRGAVLVSPFGPGDRSRAGLHRSPLGAAERAALLDALRVAPLETWTPPPPGRNPGPTDQPVLTLFVAAGPRAVVVHAPYGDFHAGGLDPLLRHLEGLRTTLANR